MRLLAAECAKRLSTAYFRSPKPVRWGMAAGLPIALIVLLVWAIEGQEKFRPTFDEQGRLVQRGTVTEGVGIGEFEVIYDRPFAVPPELSWAYKPLGYEWIQQRADGFRFKITLRGAHNLAPRWVAKGVAAEPES